MGDILESLSACEQGRSTPKRHVVIRGARRLVDDRGSGS